MQRDGDASGQVPVQESGPSSGRTGGAATPSVLPDLLRAEPRTSLDGSLAALATELEQVVGGIDPVVRQKTRRRLLAVAAVGRPASAPETRLGLLRRRPFLPRVAVLTGIVALAVGVTAHLSASALPGDRLYGVKTAREHLSIFLTTNLHSDGVARLVLADRRVGELEQLAPTVVAAGGPRGSSVLAGRADDAHLAGLEVSTLHAFDTQTQAGMRSLVADGRAEDAALVVRFTDQMTDRLTALQPRLEPTAQDVVATSLDMLVSARAVAVTALGAPATLASAPVLPPVTVPSPTVSDAPLPVLPTPPPVEVATTQPPTVLPTVPVAAPTTPAPALAPTPSSTPTAAPTSTTTAPASPPTSTSPAPSSPDPVQSILGPVISLLPTPLPADGPHNS